MTVPASEWIERDLDVLIAEWAGFPALADEWPDWDEYSKLALVEDWGSRNVMLGQLRNWAAHGFMSCDQYGRYRELLALIEKYDALRQHLFET